MILLLGQKRIKVITNNNLTFYVHSPLSVYANYLHLAITKQLSLQSRFEVSLKYNSFLKLFNHYNLLLVEETRDEDRTYRKTEKIEKGVINSKTVVYPELWRLMVRIKDNQQNFSHDNHQKTLYEGSIFENKADFPIFAQ